MRGFNNPWCFWVLEGAAFGFRSIGKRSEFTESGLKFGFRLSERSSEFRGVWLHFWTADSVKDPQNSQRLASFFVAADSVKDPQNFQTLASFLASAPPSYG